MHIFLQFYAIMVSDYNDMLWDFHRMLWDLYVLLWTINKGLMIWNAMVCYAMSFEKNTISHTEVFRTKIIIKKVYHTAMLTFLN